MGDAPAVFVNRPVTLFASIALVLVTACAAPASAPTSRPGTTARASGAAPASPTASPAQDPGRVAVKAFVALVTKKGFSYQATFTGDSRHTTDILPLRSGVLQVSGADVLVRVTFTFPNGDRPVVEHRYVGGKAWLREVPRAWTRMTLKAADSMAAFASVKTVADVTYHGPKKDGSRTLYSVSFRSAIVNPRMIPAVNLSETVLSTPKLTLLIDAAGTPIRGTAEIDGRGRVSGQLQEIVIDLTVTFTKVGRAVTITAP
jgi:hypothetical protein